jgi:hypothetical protein
MRRRVALPLLAVVVVVVAAMVVRAGSDERPVQQGLGVFVLQNEVTLRSGHEGCQGPIGLTDRTASVEFNPGTPHAEPGPAVATLIRDVPSTHVVSRGLLPAGFDPRRPQTVRLTPALPANAVVQVCFRNLGPGQVLLFGDTAFGTSKVGFVGVHPTIVTSSASLDGKDLPGHDIAMVFPRAKPKSVLALVPEMFKRAALFRPGWLGAWTYWVLAALVLLAAPLLLARAASRAVDVDED